MIKISVIIPCFNGADYLNELCKCLKDCVNDDTEIIFIDDGSSDDSSTMFQKLCPNAKIVSIKNSGLAAARNVGAQIASGEYLQFLDVDDLIVQGKIDAQYEFAQKNGFDIVYSDWQMVTVKSSEIKVETAIDVVMKDIPINELLRGWWHPFHSYLIRRTSYFEVGGGDESLVNAQDFDLLVRLAINGKLFGYLPGMFSKYFRFENTLSLSRRSEGQYWKDYRSSILNNYNLISARGESNDKIRFIVANRLFGIARNTVKFDNAFAIESLTQAKNISGSYYHNQKKTYRLSLRFFGFTITEKLLSFFKKSQ